MNTKTLTIVGLGVAGVGTLMTVLYMRNASAAAAAAANNDSATPYFQTAALPSSVTGSSDTSVSGGASGQSLDVAGLISSITDGQTAATASNTNLGFAADATSLMDSISKLLLGQTGAGGGGGDGSTSLADAFAQGANNQFAQDEIGAAQVGAQNWLAAPNAAGDIYKATIGGMTSNPFAGISPSSLASRLIGSISIGGINANVNLIADHPNSAGLYLTTPPLAFVGDPNAPVGGSSSQTGNVLLGNTTETPATQAAA